LRVQLWQAIYGKAESLFNMCNFEHALLCYHTGQVCIHFLFSVRCFKQIWKVGKVGKVGKVDKVGKVGKVSKVGKVGSVGKVGKVGKERK
jgi:hypothetical protein